MSEGDAELEVGLLVIYELVQVVYQGTQEVCCFTATELEPDVHYNFKATTGLLVFEV